MRLGPSTQSVVADNELDLFLIGRTRARRAEPRRRSTRKALRLWLSRRGCGDGEHRIYCGPVRIDHRRGHPSGEIEPMCTVVRRIEAQRAEVACFSSAPSGGEGSRTGVSWSALIAHAAVSGVTGCNVATRVQLPLRRWSATHGRHHRRRKCRPRRRVLRAARWTARSSAAHSQRAA